MMIICGPILEPSGFNPIPGSTNPYGALAARLAGKPLWIFHGEEDRAVPVREARKMAAELQARNANFKYTEYPHTQHNSWDKAYADENLPDWMMSQRLP